LLLLVALAPVLVARASLGTPASSLRSLRLAPVAASCAPGTRFICRARDGARASQPAPARRARADVRCDCDLGRARRTHWLWPRETQVLGSANAGRAVAGPGPGIPGGRGVVPRARLGRGSRRHRARVVRCGDRGGSDDPRTIKRARPRAPPARDPLAE